MNYSKFVFGLINKNTLKNLAKGKTLLPYKKVNGKKDERWNTKLITSKVMQGMISGSSIPDIAKSFRDVMEMNKASSYRNARTAITCCENKGRLHAMYAAEKIGVSVKKMWMSTHDNRTRESHRMLDGEVVDIHEEFSNGLMEPGDEDMEGSLPEEVYNCRCTMVGVVDGVDPELFRENAHEKVRD